MRIRQIVIALLSLALISTTASAAAEFFLAKNTASKKCEVVDKKPDGKTSTMIGTKSFATKADAETAMKADAACK